MWTLGMLRSAFLGLLKSPSCPMAALHLTVVSPHATVEVGTRGDGDAEKRDSRAYGSDSSIRLQVDAWTKPVVSCDVDKIVSLSLRLLEAYWKPESRSPVAGLPDYQRSDLKDEAEHTCENERLGGRQCVVLFCDLDNFKSVNTEYTQAGGDRVISELGAVLESVAREEAFVMHKGGDEFCMLMPNATSEMGIRLAHGLHRAVQGHDFGVPKCTVSLSVGIASTEQGDCSFTDLVARADDTLKSGVKNLTKGTARVAQESFCAAQCAATTVAERTAAEAVVTAFCLAKSTATTERPFASAWVNAASMIVQQSATETGSLTSACEEALDYWAWAALKPLAIGQSRSVLARSESIDLCPAASDVDLAIGVYHGILRYWLSSSQAEGTEGAMHLEYGANAGSALCHTLGEAETCLVVLGGEDAVRESLDLGPLLSLAEGEERAPGTAAGVALVQLGAHSPSLPSELFAETVIVDDRPVRGGGLPDFWEGALAQLATAVLDNPNIAAVCLFGDEKSCPGTVLKLSAPESWDEQADEIAGRCGLTAPEVRRAAELLAGKVVFPKNEAELLDVVNETLRAKRRLSGTRDHVQGTEAARFLKRVLDGDAFAPPKDAGCEVATIAEAYPVVLELARRANGETTMIDQSGRELVELIDFRLHLTDPQRDLVPTFYNSGAQRESLEEYFTHNFTTADGLFFRELQEQLEPVLSHVASSIDKHVCTRRAVLVVPHHTNAEVEGGSRSPSPLGLISVRIIPRFRSGEMRLSYSFTWRSVEALIGFPYSLYGSVRFAQHLTAQIRDRVAPAGTPQVSMADVYYIAHSMHLFTQRFAQNIARRIVEDASE